MHRTSNPRKAGPRRLPLAAAIWLVVSTAAFAQQAAPAQEAPQPAPDATKPEQKPATLETVTVTAQKRTENLQKVPVSVQVLGQQKLEQLNLTKFNDYVNYLPSVSFDTGEGGTSVPYMRGVASGENNNHSGPQPSVGVYLDEQSVTTIGGVLDVHLYDIARVEALAGPQGTLYGASSEAGTLRIITNKPDPRGFAAGYAVEANSVTDGGNGFTTEGFINVPLSPSAAIRLVGWNEKDAGYIDNVHATRTLVGWDEFSGGHGTIDNAALVKKDANDVNTNGVRGALQINLGDNWTITPAVMTQRQKVNGNFAEDPVVGKRKTHKFYPETLEDRWTQSALTVQGKIGNFDLTYAYAHLSRDVEGQADYSDYSFWYDAYYQNYYASQGLPNYYSQVFVDDNGNPINPSQYILSDDRYTKRSHELRITSPQDWRMRFLLGAFWQQQSHDILQDYKIVGDLATPLEVTGWPDTIWLTDQVRQDHDEAVFGEVSFDVTDKLTVTGGARYYRYDNSLKGFFGYSANYSSNLGEAKCFPGSGPFHGAPCVNLDAETKKSDTIGRFNVSYKIDDDRMVYATWAQGFRPGGLNRNSLYGSYLPDTLTSYEFGWKTGWFDHRLVFNGAVFQENWEDIQFSFLPPHGSGLTVINNAGNARIRGVEADVGWAATYNLRLNGGFAWYDSQLQQDYCETAKTDPDPNVCSGADYGGFAKKGTRLPVTPDFKGNLTARYTFDWGHYEPFVQGAVVYVGNRRSALSDQDAQAFGDLDAYTLVDVSAGIIRDNWTLEVYIKNLFDEQNQLTKFAQCTTSVCGTGNPLVPDYPNGQVYEINGTPRTIGVRFSQNF